MSEHDSESRLIGDIYDAALDPRLWTTVIEAVAGLAHAEQGNLLAFDRLNPEYFLFHSVGTTPESLERYQTGGFAAMDMEFAGRWMEHKGGLCRAVANHQYFGGIENYIREAGPLYTDFFAKVGILYQCGGLLEKTDFRWSVLGLHRSEKGGAFEDEVIDRLSRLLPHLRRALEVHRQLVAAQQQNALLYRVLDGLAVGVLLVDSERRVRYANTAAEALLRQHGGLQVSPRHELRALSPRLNQELQSLLEGAIRTSHREASPQPGGGVVACPDGRDGLAMLTVTPLSELAGYAELGNDGIAAAVFMSNPHSRHQLAQSLLKRAYGLTEREASLCEAFVNSPTLESVAETCGLSLNSVRTYMKDIYAKTGERSQAELMRLLMGLRTNFEHLP